jgi:type IV secretory pathway VirB6-like protein
VSSATSYRVPTAAAIGGLFILLPWTGVTLSEVEHGWEDAIWHAAPWNDLAIGLLLVGALAALAALVAAITLVRRVAWAALAVEAAAAIGWLVLLYVTPT